MSIRDTVIAEIQLLASASEQLRYEREVPQANVPAELICQFCDDLFRPKSAAFTAAFTSDELKDLAHLYGLMVEASKAQVTSVTELLKRPEWRRVMTVAKDLSARFARAV